VPGGPDIRIGAIDAIVQVLPEAGSIHDDALSSRGGGVLNQAVRVCVRRHREFVPCSSRCYW